jgi:hypothetical protein
MRIPPRHPPAASARATLGVLSLAAACLGLVGCVGGRRTPETDAAAATRDTAAPFSAERAWTHLQALTGLGPRPSGSVAAQEAREYLRSRLEAAGAEVWGLTFSSDMLRAGAAAGTEPLAGVAAAGDPTVDAVEDGDPTTHVAAGAPEDASDGERATVLHHLVARLPGDFSPDSILLLAHYDTADWVGNVGANDGASGPAVLLELARQIGERPLPYATEIVLLDGEMRIDPARPDVPELLGSRLLAFHLERAGTLDRIRMALVFRRVCDADLQIPRDLHSHRLYRDLLYRTAQRIGAGDVFDGRSGFVETASSHLPFFGVGFDRIVSIMDPWYGAQEQPGPHWGTAEDTPERCSPESLGTVGRVAHTALRDISAKLAKIDRVTGRADRRRMEERAREGATDAGPGPSAVPEEPGEAATDELPGEAPEPEPAAEAPPESS